MVCPKCGSTDVNMPMVDNGVGMEQCGSAACLDCGWAQAMPVEERDADDPF